MRQRRKTTLGYFEERAWAEVARLAPGYGKYAEQTDRQIPIVRLSAI